MSPERVTLPWGSDELTLELPAGWRPLGIVQPQPLPPVSDVAAETARALADPIGSAPLRRLAAGAGRVALVVDDISRPTPAAAILPGVLDELAAAGIADDQICLLPALGVHRGMSEADMLAKVGPGALRRLHWINHAFDDPTALAYVGTTRRGTPVHVNRHLAQADLIVSVGCIEPHVIASFGGGWKNVVPGLAGKDTIAANHAINCQPATFNMVGQPCEANPMRLDLEEAGALVGKPAFIVNAILNPALRPVRIVAGDPVQAHREGVRTSARLYGVEIEAPADVVITNSCPMDTDVRQGFKALANTVRATRAGGVIFTCLRASEGMGALNVPSREIPLGKGAMRAVASALLPFFGRLKLNGMQPEDRFFIYFALQTLRRYNVVFYSPSVPADVSQRLRFLDFNADLGTALGKARAAAPSKAGVLVFPHGGVTYPILPAH